MRIVRGSTALVLVLLTPFLVFLKHHGYQYWRPEALCCLALLAVVGLGLGVLASTTDEVEVLTLAAALTFFVDIQFDDGPIAGLDKARALAAGFVLFGAVLWVLRTHASRVIALMAATAIVATFLLPPDRATPSDTLTSAVGREDLPLIVHLILDEHIGIEGIPTQGTLPTLQSDLRTFYQSNGFSVFGSAYSEYAKTERSLGHLFNFSPGKYLPDLVRPGRSGFALGLKRNAYFAGLREKGYAVHIYQSDWLDMCPDEDNVATCDTYRASGLAVLQDLPLRSSIRARLIAEAYLDRSILYGKVRGWYAAVRRRLSGVGIRLPRWSSGYSTAPFNSAAEVKRIVHDLPSTKGGEFFFAHLLLPHSPYVYDENCQIQPVERWLPRENADASPGVADTADGRAVRYSLYALQVRCTLRMVREIIEAIPDPLRRDAIVIVQGDHGSRISVVDPGTSRADAMSMADYADNYSTLFAVRSPHMEPRYDTQFTPITCILQRLVESGFRSAAGLDACSRTSVVFMRDDQGTIIPEPLPVFVPSGG